MSGRDRVAAAEGRATDRTRQSGRAITDRIGSTRASDDQDRSALSTASLSEGDDSERSSRRSSDDRSEPTGRDRTRRSADDSDRTLATASQSLEADTDTARSSFRTSDSRDSVDLTSDDNVRSYSRSPRERSSRIVVEGDNNVIVQGDVTVNQTRPYIPPRRVRSISYIRTSPYWRSYGSSFVFRWSSRSCGVVAVVPYYDYYGVTYYYPRYHRRFVFVSLGGYWPSYRHVRYYWYGAHPYHWYGPHVISAPASHVTYNIYNTHAPAAPQAPAAPAAPAPQGSYHYDPSVDDFSDVRQRLAAEQKAIDTPYFESAADLSFAHAVSLFEAGNYQDAAKQFAEAMQLSPDDSILPFTYAQALFATGDYAAAADVLRAAMARIPPEEPTVYYPRGLYDDDNTLSEQVGDLIMASAGEPDNTDYQLLLGYHYLALEDYSQASMLLNQAAADEKNAGAVDKLLDLIDRLQSAQADVLN